MELLEGKVVGIYNNINDANKTLEDLYKQGFNEKYVSVIGKNTNSIIIPEVIADSNTEVIRSDINSGAGTSAPSEIVKGVNVNNTFDEIRRPDGNDVTENDIKDGAKSGAMLGMVGALAALMVPGIGPVLAAGPIMAALSSVAGGAAIGSVLSLLKDDRIPNSRADFYTTRFNEGNILIFIDADEKFLGAAKAVLAKNNPVTIDTF